MFPARVHVTARTHTPRNEAQGASQRALPSQRFHDAPAAIAHDLGEFDQAALGIPAWAKCAAWRHKRWYETYRWLEIDQRERLTHRKEKSETGT